MGLSLTFIFKCFMNYSKSYPDFGLEPWFSQHSLSFFLFFIFLQKVEKKQLQISHKNELGWPRSGVSGDTDILSLVRLNVCVRVCA